MKKTLVLITAMLLLVITGCSSIVKEQAVKEVSVDEVVSKIDSGETFAFILGSASCPACKQYRTNLKELHNKENLVLDYIDLDVVKPEDRDKVIDLIIRLGGNPEEGVSTPTTYFMIDGEVNGEPIVGAVSSDEIVEVYKEGMTKQKDNLIKKDESSKEKSDVDLNEESELNKEESESNKED